MAALRSGCKPRVLNKFRNKDSRTLTNGHLSTTATFFVLADSPYIGSCLNLSTTESATKACPQLPK